MPIEDEIKTELVISDAEMSRRWKLVREAMKERKLDFLVMQNSHTIMQGNVRYLTGLKVGDGYPVTLLFPREDDMTVITHGTRVQQPLGPIMGQPLRGIKKHITTPVLPTFTYGNTVEAQFIADELSKYKNIRVGFAAMAFIPASFYVHLTGQLKSAEFEDATEMMDNIRVIKSEEEISFIRNTCLIEDALWEYALTQVKPGVAKSTVRRNVIRKGMDYGVEGFNIGIGAAPAGRPASMSPEDRVLQDGDQLEMLIETDGPGGLWGELSRTVCLGKIPAQLQEQFEIACQAQTVSADLLKPGNPAAKLMEASNAFLKSKGYPEEMRIYAHGQGYDMVERPCLDVLEPMILKAGMMLAVHPEAKSEKAHGWVCDDFLIKQSGEAERLHRTPQKVFVV